MKKLFLISAAAVFGLAALPSAALAQGYVRTREYREDAWRGRSGRLSDELDRLNYRFERVRERLRSSGGGYLWREYGHLSRERDRLNWQIRRGGVDPYRARREIERIRAGLANLEDQLRG